MCGGIGVRDEQRPDVLGLEAKFADRSLNTCRGLRQTSINQNVGCFCRDQIVGEPTPTK